MRKCPNCGAFIRQNNGICPMCDYRFETKSRKTTRGELGENTRERAISHSPTPEIPVNPKSSEIKYQSRLQRRAILYAVLSSLILPWPGIFIAIRIATACRKNKNDPTNTKVLQEEIRNAQAYIVFAIIFILIWWNTYH